MLDGPKRGGLYTITIRNHIRRNAIGRNHPLFKMSGRWIATKVHVYRIRKDSPLELVRNALGD